MNRELELVNKYSPHILFDKNEPFFPVKVGYSIIDKPGRSPSFNRIFEFNEKNLDYIIEYAIYWDYDIQHLYELEHFWVYVAKDGSVIQADASFHGHFFRCLLKDRSNLSNETHVVIYSQPGKHAFSPMIELLELVPDLREVTNEKAGKAGLLITKTFEGCYSTSQEINEMVCRYLKQFAFNASMEFKKYIIPSELFVTWKELYDEVPTRIAQQLEVIRAFVKQ